MKYMTNLIPYVCSIITLYTMLTIYYMVRIFALFIGTICIVHNYGRCPNYNDCVIISIIGVSFSICHYYINSLNNEKIKSTLTNL